MLDSPSTTSTSPAAPAGDPRPASLGLYAALDRLGRPASYAGKIFLVAFLTTHIPLLTLIGFLLWRPDDSAPLPVALVTLVATLVGTALSMVALGTDGWPLWKGLVLAVAMLLLLIAPWLI